LATVNIGNLTFTHRGDYAGGTAYAKNDVVYYATNGNAYIAKQATTGNVPTNGTYWSQFAAGSGGIWNAGLSLGSAGQAVKVNAAGNALEFGTISSDYVKLQNYTSLSGASGNYISFDFSSLFTSDYRYYKLRVDGMYNASGSGHQVRGRINVGGSLKSDSHYRVTGVYSDNYSGGPSVSGHNRWDNDYFTLTWLEDSQPQNNTFMEIDFHNPTNTTEYPKWKVYSQGMDNSYIYQMLINCMYKNSTDDIQGISFWGNANTTIHFGNATLYGIK